MAGSWWYYEIIDRKIIKRKYNSFSKTEKLELKGEVYRSRPSKEFKINQVLSDKELKSLYKSKFKTSNK